MSISMRELYWAAGFMEGEGSFTSQRYLVSLQAVQVQRQPLERLQSLFGGSIRAYRRNTTVGNEYHKWEIAGRKAAAVAMTLYVLMSPRRQQQITVALAKWKAVKTWAQKVAERTHCKAGHPLAGENLYVNPRGFRQCVTCKRIYRRKYSTNQAT